MDNEDLTRRFIRPPQPEIPGGMTVTIFDADRAPRTFDLSLFEKSAVTFGRDQSNDIVLQSRLVSHLHGRFCFRDGYWYIEDRSVYSDTGSTNGLIYNDAYIQAKQLEDGDFIRIDDNVETVALGVLFVFSTSQSANDWHTIDLQDRQSLTIGRYPDCDIVLPHISVSKHHARITHSGGNFYIEDTGSTNGVYVNNKKLTGRRQLHEKDVIVITNSKLIFTSSVISYCCFQNGISVEADHVVIRRGRGSKSHITGNDISLSVRPGELVAIVGGSGAGKTTLLNCLNGYLSPSQGAVYINGINLYQDFDALKRLIGYVPQSDIVYDNLTLHDMLLYTARLRLPKDTSLQEMEQAIDHAVNVVNLPDKKESRIKHMSGGQKKRASIALELLSDPNLLFLDEPCSGLDPGTEQSLMRSLRRMADSGKTVILVTHSTLQLQLCDKIAFMGDGGNLCFYGSLDDALAFFGVSSAVDIYDMITDQPLAWREKYEKQFGIPEQEEGHLHTLPAHQTTPNGNQLSTLCARYAKLLINDRVVVLLLLLQAPFLSLLIALVAGGSQFEQYEMTKSLLFALSCSGFWVGMLNAIREICKERNILKREYMAGLSLSNYLLSKFIVLGVFALIQSFLMVTVFALTVGMPPEGVFMAPYFEFWISIFLTILAATALGLFVSAIAKNADRAMVVAPILLLPQLLFSGLLFELNGATKVISWFTVCRWSIEALGTTSDLNALPLQLQQQGLALSHEAEDFFTFSFGHLIADWGILILFVIVCMALARLVLSSLRRERAGR